MKKLYLLLALLCTLFGFSQFNPNAPWTKNGDETDLKDKKLSELVSDFENYWLFRDKNKKGSGYKPFMRWVENWKNSINDEGYVISAQELWNIWEQKNRAKSNKTNSNRSLPPSNWHPIGPTQNASLQSTRGRGRVNVICIDPTNPSTIYFGAPAGGIWKSINEGLTWAPLTDYLPQIGVSGIAVDYNNPNIIYISTGDKDSSDSPSIGVLKSIDGGASWSTTGLSFDNAQKGAGDILIHPTNSQMLWCITSTGVYRTINGGTTWVNELSGNFTQGSLRLKPNNPSIVYVSSSNKFYKSINSGDTFSNFNVNGLPADSGRLIFDVTAANPNFVYCLSASTSYAFQGIFKSTDGGSTFVNTGLSTNIFESSQAWFDLAFCVSQTNANEIYSGCLNIWKSTDGGVTATKLNRWELYSPSFTHADIHFLKFINNKLYCGSDGGIYVSEDGGVVFNDIIGQAQIGQFYKISVSKQTASKLTGGLQDNGGYAYNNTIWQSYHGGDGMDNAIDPNNSNKAYGFVQYGGTLFESNNLGLSVSSTTEAPTLNGNTLQGNWITPLMVNNNGEVYSGYSDVYKRTNGVWVRQNTSNFGFGTGNISVISLDPSNDNIMYVTKTSKLYKSIDRGITFELVFTAASNITSIAVHSSNSNIIYTTTSGSSGDAFVSTNGGTSFALVGTGLPAIGKNIIVHQGRNPLNPLYVGTSLGVYYKDDSMSGWESFDNNLPNVSVRDLEINLEDSKIIAGTFGRGVWQTDIPVEIPSIDLKFISVQNVNSTIQCGGSFSPQITVKNKGENPIYSVDIVYDYNGTPRTYTWNGNIEPNGLQNIDLPLITENEKGAYNLIISTSTTNDAFGDNNQGSTRFYINDSGSVGVVNTFESPSSNLLSYTEDLITSQWQKGVRTGGTLPSGSNNVYTTNLSGNHPDAIKAYLISQCYDFTQITNPVIRFKMAFDLEINWDVVYVQYSTDFGQTWNVLGIEGPSWYNSSRTNVISGASNDCQNCPGSQWTGTDLDLKEYFYPLNSLVGNANVIFRIVFQSDEAVNQQGVVIDDFVVEGTLANEQFEIKNIAIYPNPSKGFFNISMGTIEPKTVTVYDLTGKNVYSISEFQNNPSQFVLDLTSISSGIYFVKIACDNQSVTKRIIKN